MESAAGYLAIETLSVLVVVLGLHALRRSTSLVYSYAALAFMTFAAWAAPHGSAIALGPIHFYVESSVFFTASLLGLFLLYVVDGPRAGRMALGVVAGTGILYTGFALLLHAQFSGPGELPPAIFPSASGRSAVASLIAAVTDLFVLGIAWELVQKRRALPLFIRVLLTLVAVLFADTLVYTPIAWAGDSGFGAMISGGLLSRGALALLYAPIVTLYLSYEIRTHGLQLASRPVLSIVTMEDLERELQSARYTATLGVEALWASEERYRRMVDDIPLMVFRFSRDGVLTYANRGLCKYYGRTLEEMAGSEVLAPIKESERQRIWAQIEALSPESATVTITVFVTLPSGKRRLQRWIVRAIFSAEQHGLAFQAVGEDITEKNLREQDLKRLKRAVDQASDCVAIADAAGKLQFVNAALEAHCGKSRSELLGQPVTCLLPLPSDRAALKPAFEAIGGGGQWLGRVRLSSPGLSRREFRLTVTEADENENEGKCYIGMAHDVSREVELELRLQQARKMEAIGQLAGGVGHDFNNLLTIILTAAQVAERQVTSSRDDNPQRLVESLRTVQQATDKASQLARQLLTMGSREVIKPKAMDLSSLTSSLSSLLRQVAGKAISLTLKCPSGLPLVELDPAQFEIVIVNLVINARDAMPLGGHLEVETLLVNSACPSDLLQTQGDKNAEVAVSVRDTGVGMDAETRLHIFEPFFSTKGPEGGSGLGLASVYSIVQQASGRIVVDSEPGHGATFTVYLPALSARTQQRPKDVAERSMRRSSRQGVAP